MGKREEDMDQMMSSTKLPRDFPKAHQLPKTLFCMVGFQLMKHSESFFLSLSLSFVSLLSPSLPSNWPAAPSLPVDLLVGARPPPYS
jgi:hypothetical protein